MQMGPEMVQEDGEEMHDFVFLGFKKVQGEEILKIGRQHVKYLNS